MKTGKSQFDFDQGICLGCRPGRGAEGATRLLTDVSLTPFLPSLTSL